MRQIASVADFVDRFFQKALLQECAVWRQAIELLSKTASGNQRAGAAELCLAKHKSENRNVEVDIRDPKDPPRFLANIVLHARENLG